jgi:hypothetical protein
MSNNEAELLLQINQGLPPEIQQRYQELIAKRRSETLTSDEYSELLRLTGTVESLEAKRVESLAELAIHRKTSITALMEQLYNAERITQNPKTRSPQPPLKRGAKKESKTYIDLTG